MFLVRSWDLQLLWLLFYRRFWNVLSGHQRCETSVSRGHMLSSHHRPQGRGGMQLVWLALFHSVFKSSSFFFFRCALSHTECKYYVQFYSYNLWIPTACEGKVNLYVRYHNGFLWATIERELKMIIYAMVSWPDSVPCIGRHLQCQNRQNPCWTYTRGANQSRYLPSNDSAIAQLSAGDQLLAVAPSAAGERHTAGQAKQHQLRWDHRGSSHSGISFHWTSNAFAWSG